MFDRYNLNMSRQQQQVLMAWSKQHPVSAWERERNDRIAKVVGHSNPFVTGQSTWAIGYRPRGEGVVKPDQKASQAESAARSNVAISQGNVIGNKNSRVYHLSVGCPSYSQVSEKNRVPFETEAEAVDAGFRKAGNCR